jgi:hypothetical protein
MSLLAVAFVARSCCCYIEYVGSLGMLPCQSTGSKPLLEQHLGIISIALPFFVINRMSMYCCAVSADLAINMSTVCICLLQTEVETHKGTVVSLTHGIPATMQDHKLRTTQ